MSTCQWEHETVHLCLIVIILVTLSSAQYFNDSFIIIDLVRGEQAILNI